MFRFRGNASENSTSQEHNYNPVSHNDELGGDVHYQQRQPHSLNQDGPTEARYAAVGSQEASGDSQLPAYDHALKTRWACSAAVVIAALSAVACFVSLGVIVTRNPKNLSTPISLSSSGAEVVGFLLNIALTLMTDSVGFVHSSSLRWSLYREGRLDYNTNIRLLTSSRKSAPNRWYINAVSMACLILCYAGTSQLFLRGDYFNSIYPTCSGTQCACYGRGCVSINPAALGALGIGLLGQATIGAWCLGLPKLIPTWSANPLNTTLVAMHDSLRHHPNRCMLSVHQLDQPDGPSLPQRRQQSASRSSKTAVRNVVWAAWVGAGLAIIWSLVILVLCWSQVSRRTDGGTWSLKLDWNPHLDSTQNVVNFYMTPVTDLNETSFSPAAQYVCGVLFICVVQALQTIALHCVELLTNISRDEDSWRHASVFLAPWNRRLHGAGARLEYPPFVAAALSWQNAILFMLKAALHWLLGQSLTPTYGQVPSGAEFGFYMAYTRLFVYAIVAVFLAVFATYLGFRRPRGSQPAAWGHLQTLANLIDDWETVPEGNNRLYWGDKTVGPDVFGGSGDPQVRHAGTYANPDKLGPISTVTLYAGGARAGAVNPRRRRHGLSMWSHWVD